MNDDFSLNELRIILSALNLRLVTISQSHDFDYIDQRLKERIKNTEDIFSKVFCLIRSKELLKQD
jgi:hypothetical protein